MTPAPRRALHRIARPAIATVHARRVVMHEDELARLHVLDTTAHLLSVADHFVPEHRVDLALQVPLHEVAGADPARGGPNEKLLIGPELGS